MSSRNYAKYVYLTIALIRNGETHKALLADAEESDSKQLPTIAGLRLRDFYELKKAGVICVSTPHQEVRPGQTLAKEPSTDNVIAKSDIDVDANTDAAADTW